MLARVPESMWSIRCEIGWPIVTFVPGSVAELRAAAPARSSARGRPVSRRPTSISAASTPCTCSSYSARPVRRAVATTSGCASRICSTRAPDLVGLRERRARQRVRLHGEAPSWNSAGTRCPARVIAARRRDQERIAGASTTSGMVQRARQHAARTSASARATAIRRGRAGSIARPAGTRSRAPGVTTRATTSDASSATM